jgi:hypothetical protein
MSTMRQKAADRPPTDPGRHGKKKGRRERESNSARAPLKWNTVKKKNQINKYKYKRERERKTVHRRHV